MANDSQLERLKRGIKSWNSWRGIRRDGFVRGEVDLSSANLVEADLSAASLSGVDFREADLRAADLVEADLRAANLRAANLSNANLRKADLRCAQLIEADLRFVDLRSANLTGADLSGADLCRANFHFANLSGADLSFANLSGADLSFANLSFANLSFANLSSANLSKANLSSANLSKAQVLNAIFSQATLTGVCIFDWQIGISTVLEDVVCDYIFRTEDKIRKFSGRLPVDENSFFADGEFTKRFQILASALETIDLTFTEGIDWQAFFQSFQEVCNNRPTESLSIQGMERKGQAFIVRLEANADTDKAALETEVKQLYALQLAALETQYAERLKLQGVQVEDARETIQVERLNNATLMKIIANMAENQGSKYEFNAPVGNVVDTAQAASHIQSIQHNYPPEQDQNLADAAKEIQELLDQLSTTYPVMEVPGQALEKIQHNPQMKDRVMGALKAGGKTALEKLVDRPAVSILLAAIEGASNPSGSK